ncbi:unnamed protein product [Adineta ricciae]|uniref:Uncharacterized protein n=1 Tax=Adineta ricciae TaxID=249248 RepID=A0A815BE67_ADIRI|nr:unnamed protein product [Adineta ricciae]
MNPTGTDCSASSLGSLTSSSVSEPVVTTAVYDTNSEVLYISVCYSDGSPYHLFTYTVKTHYLTDVNMTDALIDMQVLE